MKQTTTAAAVTAAVTETGTSVYSTTCKYVADNLTIEQAPILYQGNPHTSHTIMIHISSDKFIRACQAATKLSHVSTRGSAAAADPAPTPTDTKPSAADVRKPTLLTALLLLACFGADVMVTAGTSPEQRSTSSGAKATYRVNLNRIHVDGMVLCR